MYRPARPLSWVSRADAVTAVKSTSLRLTSTTSLTSLTGSDGQYLFTRFYHPYACRFIKEVRRHGVFGLLDPDPAGTASLLFRQQLNEDLDGASNDFDTRYDTAPPLYSAFIFDPSDNTFRPLFQPQEGVMITDLVAAQPRAPQTTILDSSIAEYQPSREGSQIRIKAVASGKTDVLLGDPDGTVDDVSFTLSVTE